MVEAILTFFEKLVTDFSWRRIILITFFVAAALGGSWGFESYTGHFRLARIEKEIALLERLAQLGQIQAVQQDERLNAVYVDLQTQLADASQPKTYPVSLSPPAKQALAAAAAWLILVAFPMYLVNRKEASLNVNAYAGMALVAAPFVLVAALLPAFEASWINYWLYPVGHVVVVVGAVLIWQRNRSQHEAAAGDFS